MQKISPDKLPPQNIDAEKSLLGSILIDREAVNKVADYLKAIDFYQRGHQIIYEAVMALFDRREPIDLLNLSNKLEEMRSEEHTSELQSQFHLVCRLLLEKKK